MCSVNTQGQAISATTTRSDGVEEDTFELDDWEAWLLSCLCMHTVIIIVK